MTWNPWTALRDRTHVTLGFTPLPAALGGAVYVPVRRNRAVILLDPALSQRERNRALAHELVHEERGGGADRPGMPPDWQAVVARDERQTDDEAISRLVPIDDLVRWCARRSTVGDPIEPHVVAEEWHVTEEVARRALSIAVRAATAPMAPRDAG